MKPFADLHHHSENSLLDGMGSVARHVKRCVELGHSAVAFTEHGTCRGFVALDAACSEQKIKPVYGCEVYVCQDHTRKALTEEQIASVTAGKSKAGAKKARAALEHVEGIHERRHLVVLAGNDDGLQNLIKLQNHANMGGFYYKPRVDLALLERYSEGLFINSGCIGGVLAQSYFDGDLDRVFDDLEFFVDVFGDRFSLEIQPHPIDLQEQWNRVVLKLSEEFDVPIVVANDSHYPAPDDWRAHDTLVCVGTGQRVHDCDRLRYEAETFGLKSAEDMVEAFARVHPYIPRAVVEAGLERSAEIAERCNAKLFKPSGVLLPKVKKAEMKGFEDEDETLTRLCIAGWKWRGINDGEGSRTPYKERLEHELQVIKGKGFSNYFLIVHELLNWSREQGILTGPGRGSAAGSLVCYLLGITSLDPIEHGLLFERFLTPGRVDWPDIDCDVEDRRRPEVLQHLRDQYGEDCVAQISTVSRMRARAAFKDVAKAHGLNAFTVNALTSAIVDEKTRVDPGESHDTLRKAVDSTPALAAFEDAHPEVIDHGCRLEGNMRHVGIHPSGVVTSPRPLAEFVPLERRKSAGEELIVTAYDMRDCETVGLIKLDVLGLRTLSVIADTVRMIERRHNVKIDLERVSLTDGDVLDAFTQGDFAGVFQFDTQAARSACEGVIFDSFDDIVAMNALNRPGPAKSGLADAWRSRKLGKEFTAGHEIVETICSDTLGVIAYQEHVIRILQDLAGYSPEEAGRLRKAISKSKGVGYLEAERPVFVAGAEAKGMDERDADALWSQIEEFGAYGFNKSHAAAYSMLSYWGQWLKTAYPVEFFCGLLIHEPDTDKANGYVREAFRRGIKILPPDINASKTSWSVKGKSLLTGLEAVKRCGSKACDEIVSNAPFDSFADFVQRVNRRVVNKGVIEALVKAGALRTFFPNTRVALDIFDNILKSVGRKNWVAKAEQAIADSFDENDFDENDIWCLRLEVGVNGDGRHPIGAVLDLFDGYLRPGIVLDFEEAHHGSWCAGVIAAKRVGTSSGERWASLEVEDMHGARMKVRFDDAAYKEHRAVIDSGVGTLVVLNIAVSKYGSIKATAIVDLLQIRKARYSILDLTEAEQHAHSLVVSAKHPIREFTTELRSDWWRSREALVLILSVNTKRDRNNNKFAFVSVDPGIGDTSEVVVFNEVFESCRRFLQPGVIVNIRAKKEKGMIATAITKPKGTK